MQYVKLRAGLVLSLSILALILACVPRAGHAHADGRVNIRAMHLEYQARGLTAYYRLSFPLVVGAVEDSRADALDMPRQYPYTLSKVESGHTFYYADANELAGGLDVASALIAWGHRLTAAGREIMPEVLGAAVHARGNVPPFSSLEQARRAIAQPLSPDAFHDIEIDDMLFDVALFYPAVRSTDEIALQSTLSPGRLNNAPVKNVIVSHAGDRSATYSSIGLLDSPMVINPSAWTAASQFIKEGARHILEGADHLLFVACLAWQAVTLRSLMLRITAFSAGHALSMFAAYLGLVPGADWFSGAIELAIALSVFAAAVVLLADRMSWFHSSLIAAVFGVVHGMGFAFGMRELTVHMGPNIITSFLSFSLGGEVVQVVFGAVVWIVSRRYLSHEPGRRKLIHIAVPAGMALVAGSWVLERSLSFWRLVESF
ncbi:HupE/UreJ family protein [Noviherbaspirillum denitrificans]|uniref:HupE/UreJ family protein n=1 Tax=Noviherbaspirillum denitrificans TaxID=1968433 RepID=A0A254TLJ7_9BURK|nr:HupE/UreJ family protein [Noviherbaspirillum denitrificans]OWW20588.1 hypothetical protein AYR66_14920 [Noviherbaspirillum denitrificans]